MRRENIVETPSVHFYLDKKNFIAASRDEDAWRHAIPVTTREARTSWQRDHMRGPEFTARLR